MSHLSDDELVLHYYGEDGPETVAAGRHLQSCAECTREYEALTRMLSAVTAPEFVDAPDDTPALRGLLLRERARNQSSPVAASVRTEAGAIAVAWLVPILYPLSSAALFASAQSAHGRVVAAALVALTLLWACAGPFVAVLVLHRLAERFDRFSTRVLALGAVMAAISPPLFVLISRVSPGLSPWYVMLTVAALPALFRWPEAARSTARLQLVHRLSALLLGIFVLGHIANQSLAFVSVSSYTAMRSVMRVASQQPISYAVIVASVAMQVATGIAMGMKKVRAGAMTANLQAVTGWYLAAFLLTHVFSGLVLAQHGVPTAVVATSSQFDLLASARSTAQLPFLLLGVAAFLFHIGAYARLMALAYLAEASVRRLSYAAMVVGTTVVLTVGLALCGIHLMR